MAPAGACLTTEKMKTRHIGTPAKQIHLPTASGGYGIPFTDPLPGMETAGSGTPIVPWKQHLHTHRFLHTAPREGLRHKAPPLTRAVLFSLTCDGPSSPYTTCHADLQQLLTEASRKPRQEEGEDLCTGTSLPIIPLRIAEK